LLEGKARRAALQTASLDMFFARSITLLALGLLPILTHAAEPPQPISPLVKGSVDRAVKWLMQQQKKDGYFHDQKNEQTAKKGDVPGYSGAMTALAIMGLSSVGHMPSDATPEGQAVARGLKFMLEFIEPDLDSKETNGYLGRVDRSRMYGHGIMSLMFAEMLGMGLDEEMDRKVRERLDGAVKLIVKSQRVPKSDSNKGGWRYEPQSSDADISVTVWQLLALRAAKNAGLDVPDDAIKDAIAYVKRSYRSERDSMGRPKDLAAAFSYEPYGGRQTFSTTAAGLLSLQVCGQYESPEVIGSANFLMKNPPEINEPWFYYGNYYYAQGMYQRGGDFAATARRKTEDTLVKAQSPEGAWYPRNGNEKSAGAVYATALSLLSLSVYHHFLPIYQK
jgi:hypothetical protein